MGRRRLGSACPCGLEGGEVARPVIQYLSVQEMEFVHEQVLRVLAEVGVAYNSSQAIELLAEAGAHVDRERLQGRDIESLERAPARRLLNDVFIDLAIAAGADSGIIDPLANDPRRIAGLDRGSRPYRLASDLLAGADPYGGEFLGAFRAGELA